MSSTNEQFSPLASVVFLCIPALRDKPVAEQTRLRSQLESAATAACDTLAEGDRLVLDAPAGMLLVVLGDPKSAFRAAQRALSASADHLFGVSINHGPVTATASSAQDARLIGDSIDAVLSFGAQTPAGSLVVSRAYRDALARSAPEAAVTLFPAGIYTDEEVRSHELFTVSTVERRAAIRRLWLVTALACAAIIAGGVAARSVLQSLAEARRPAVLTFDIKPQGDIYVDGAMRGRTPPLSELQVAPGAHLIEVRNGKFAPLVTEVDLGPGEQLQIRHSFVAPKPAKARGLIDRLKFWQ